MTQYLNKVDAVSISGSHGQQNGIVIIGENPAIHRVYIEGGGAKIHMEHGEIKRKPTVNMIRYE